ncbi:hypothetical protein [Azohydromonas lata]|uniref:Uncharacterized protein n=1 Tax=Azohydromonas lata TaxID=45677 RepID=A0ABU5IK60_9BURK|nr:hypothetical protein [Azohydromonas lata]MDZ5459259.1 hypothetical protein [Azohydromonas lata]
MSAVPLAEPVGVATGLAHTPLASKPRRRRPVVGCRPAAARAAISRIQALMREHSITVSDLGAAYALARIHELMDIHGITIGELGGGVPPADQQLPRREVRITHCPSVGHDPRYQLPPGARVVGGFTAEWNRLRGGER